MTKGEYPPIMRELVDAKSEPGASRLPSFDAEWTRIINGKFEFDIYGCFQFNIIENV